MDELIIPDTVEKIDDCAFRGCESLERILIPSSVVELGWGVFDECSDDLVVYCDEGSEIQAYCERNKIKNDRICNIEPMRKMNAFSSSALLKVYLFIPNILLL